MPTPDPPGLARLKVAIACRQVAGLSGATTVVLEQSRRLAALGCEVHVYGDDLDVLRLEDCGAAPHRLPRWPFGSYPRRRLFAWLFERAVAGRGFDVLWGHGDALRQDILTLHNCVHAAHEAVRGSPLPSSSGVGRLHDRLLRGGGFAALIANSELMKEEVVRRFGVPARKVWVVHPGHDPARFRAEDRPRLGPEARAELGVGETELLVGLVTSGDFAKRGVGPFLDALADLKPELRRRLRLLIMGRETRLGPYRERVARAGLADRTRFLPPAADVERYYHALDVYVHPALYEEFGMSILEAMACGTPVLTSRRVGAAEVLARAPESRAALLERPEPRALRAALERLLGDAGLRSSVGEAGARVARGEDWEANFAKTLACLRAVLKERGSALATAGALAPRRAPRPPPSRG
ncbi:MAG: glycosyltransferase family 4 protein [Elusimicrobia bacterium]|nr:glycosyltransferase family 4 protein [Elusimicrobiota bacterium]